MTTGSTGQAVTHPAVRALAAGRLALSRLVGQLRLPDPDGRPLPTGRDAVDILRRNWGSELPEIVSMSEAEQDRSGLGTGTMEERYTPW